MQVTYSVWDNETQLYRYYEGPDVPIGKPFPLPNRAVGSVPADEAAPALPFGARFTGTGEEAVGRIASSGINWRQVARWGVFGLAVVGGLSLVRRLFGRERVTA